MELRIGDEVKWNGNKENNIGPYVFTTKVEEFLLNTNELIVTHVEPFSVRLKGGDNLGFNKIWLEKIESKMTLEDFCELHQMYGKIVQDKALVKFEKPGFRFLNGIDVSKHVSLEKSISKCEFYTPKSMRPTHRPYNFNDDFETCWIGEQLINKVTRNKVTIVGLYQNTLIVENFNEDKLYFTAERMFNYYWWGSSLTDATCGNLLECN